MKLDEFLISKCRLATNLYLKIQTADKALLKPHVSSRCANSGETVVPRLSCSNMCTNVFFYPHRLEVLSRLLISLSSQMTQPLTVGLSAVSEASHFSAAQFLSLLLINELVL